MQKRIFEVLNDNQHILEQALEKWQIKQYIKTVEELSELQKELCKMMLFDQLKSETSSDVAKFCALKEHIAEEIADVLIMLNQILIDLSLFNETENFLILKLKRLQTLIQQGK